MTPDDFMRDYEAASNDHNLEATLRLIDEDAVYMFSNESIHVGKETVATAIKTNFDAIALESYKISNLTWLSHTAEVAICVYDYSWSGIVGGENASGNGRGTSVIKRHGESWKVSHEHLSRGRFAADG